MYDPKELEIELSSTRPIDIASGLTTIGKEHLFEYRDMVIAYLSDPNPDIRREALSALTFHWGIKEYESIAKEAMNNDIDPFNRERALVCWTSFYRDSKNKEVLQRLAKIVKDVNYPISFRAVALRRFIFVNGLKRIPMDIGDDLYSAKSEEEFSDLVPWESLMPYLQ